MYKRTLGDRNYKPVVSKYATSQAVVANLIIIVFIMYIL